MRDAPPETASSGSLCHFGAARLARLIAQGETSAREVVGAFLARIERVNPAINALIWPTFEQARNDAEAADRAWRSGQTLGPLHGVPISIKECFHLACTPATMGLTQRRESVPPDDGLLVRQLRSAGAIVLGKTNVPQLMVWHECDNPLYGCTRNPWSLDRTPGGSSGGEAALIAARASPLGLGGDLGGSLRIPAHFSGIHTLKPTSGRLPSVGLAMALHGMEAIDHQPGPLAHKVEDLHLALRVLLSKQAHLPTTSLGSPEEVRLDQLRIAFWTDDGFFAAAPAIRRAVREAAAALQSLGTTVEEFNPPEVPLAIELYFGLTSADGAAGLRRLAAGSGADPTIARLIRLGGVPRWLRLVKAAQLKATGQERFAHLVAASGPRSTDAYWQLCHRRAEFRTRFLESLQRRGFDAIICPPHALPAFPHGTAFEMLTAASYSLLFNLLGLPAGVVAATRVRPDEESDRPKSRDYLIRTAARIERGSAGLPVGVQVAAGPWREEIVLAIMAALERHFSSLPDYPSLPPSP